MATDNHTPNPKAFDQKKRAVGIRPVGRQAKIITAKYLISIAL
jgi:hypothetical protein